MVSAKEIATYARNIVGQIANETRLRNGVGRAYYAAFHYCQTAADSWCYDLSPQEIDALDPRQKGVHSILYFRLKTKCRFTEIDKDLKFLASEAQKLKDLRTDADYYLNRVVNMDSYNRSLHHLNIVETTITELPSKIKL